MTFLLCAISFAIGFALGHLHGWLGGYDRCSEDTINKIDEYFDK